MRVSKHWAESITETLLSNPSSFPSLVLHPAPLLFLHPLPPLWQEVKHGAEESRALRTRIQLAEAAQKQARGMEMDYEEVIHLLEAEIAELKTQRMEHQASANKVTHHMDQFMVGTKQSRSLTVRLLQSPGQLGAFISLEYVWNFFQLQLFVTVIKQDGWGSRKAADCTVQPSTNQTHRPKTTKIVVVIIKSNISMVIVKKQQPFCHVMVFKLLWCSMFAAWASVSQHGNNEGGILKIQAFCCLVIAAPPPGPGFVFRPECGSGVFGDRRRFCWNPLSVVSLSHKTKICRKKQKRSRWKQRAFVQTPSLPELDCRQTLLLFINSFYSSHTKDKHRKRAFCKMFGLFGSCQCLWSLL